AAEIVVAIEQLDGTRAVPSSGIDVRAALDKIIDDVELSGHHCPMYWLVSVHVCCVQELGRLVEQTANLVRVTLANRSSNDLASGRSIVPGKGLFEQLQHVCVSAVPGDVEERVASPCIYRVRAVLEQDCGNRDLILAHGEIHRPPVRVRSADKRRILGKQSFDDSNIAGHGSLEHLPDVGSGAGRPEKWLVLLQ